MSEFRRKLMMAYAANLGRGDITYPGLIAAWSAKGKTNDDEDRAILKDLTGNGHDITLNGFTFSEMSGYGVYDNIISNGTVRSTYCDKINNVEIAVKQTHPSGISTLAFNKPSTNIAIYEINGLVDGQVIHFGNDGSREKILSVSKDGIYGVNWNDLYNINSSYYRCIYLDYNGDINCTIKNLPLYDGALLFDGVDDYGQSIDRIKALTKYTIILKRKIIKATNGGCVLYKGDLRYGDSTENFGVEFTDNKHWYYYSGLLGNNKIIPYQEDIIYAKEKSYNGQQMKSNLDNVADNPIVISTVNKTGFVNMAFYSAYLFDRSLDEQEIKEFIRKYIDSEYLLPSEIPTPDCYYDFSLGSTQGATREDIADLSGNGNDAKAYNFAWSNLSGYNGYYLTGTGKHIITNVTGENNILGAFQCPANTSITITITGIPEGATVISRATIGEHFRTTEDGTYHIGPFEGAATIAVLGFTGECNMEITEEPLYPRALVFDGVDDYIALEAFDSGFKTIFVLCNIFDNNNNKFIYDQRSGTAGTNQYALYVHDGSPAYNHRNNGSTYINSKLNTTLVPSLLVNKKHCITVTNDTLETITPIIGASALKSASCSMAIYKFLGFKEKLTEDLIQYIIKNYNLLDGVDEIEVS